MLYPNRCYSLVTRWDQHPNRLSTPCFDQPSLVWPPEQKVLGLPFCEKPVRGFQNHVWLTFFGGSHLPQASVLLAEADPSHESAGTPEHSH